MCTGAGLNIRTGSLFGMANLFAVWVFLMSTQAYSANKNVKRESLQTCMTESAKGGPHLRIARNRNYATIQDISRSHDLVTKRKFRSASCASYSQRTTFCTFPHTKKKMRLTVRACVFKNLLYLEFPCFWTHTRKDLLRHADVRCRLDTVSERPK
jgi:hypothetical protein